MPDLFSDNYYSESFEQYSNLAYSIGTYWCTYDRDVDCPAYITIEDELDRASVPLVDRTPLFMEQINHYFNLAVSDYDTI